MGDIDFEEQLEQERLAREHEEARRLDSHPQTRTDPDGTVYEWDVDKKAWFPKVKYTEAAAGKFCLICNEPK